ncbi:MAG: hypothetical protein QOH21_196 [Acidobacteriota bacterium]|nr:hypothetical protein [Acidobacteriota bacterium]
MALNGLEEAAVVHRGDSTAEGIRDISALPMHEIRASSRYAGAIEATADLLSRLRIEALFVGSVARAAWLGGEVSSGSIDVLTLMNAPQKNQVAMMASNRGYRVERAEIEQSEELDLVPINFIHEDGDVRVHVLLATNALYGRMFAPSQEARLGERTLKVPAPEDLALMLTMAGDEAAVKQLTELPEFDLRRHNERLVAIGLGELVVAE